MLSKASSLLSQVIGLFLAALEFSLCDYLLIQAWRVTTDLSKKWCLTLENHQFFSTSCLTKKADSNDLCLLVLVFQLKKECMEKLQMNLQLEERHFFLKF